MRSLGLWTALLVTLVAGHTLVDAALHLSFHGWVQRNIGGGRGYFMSSSRINALQTSWFTGFTAIVVVWCIWQWNAAANVRDRVRHHIRHERGVGQVRDDRPAPLRFTPGWGVGAWFVPILHLWTPRRVMSELWTCSRSLDGMGAGGWIVWAWWLLLLSAPMLWMLQWEAWTSVAGWSSVVTPEIAARIRAVQVGFLVRALALGAVTIALVVQVRNGQAAWPPVDEDALQKR
jgi:hypothetical protein